MSSRPAPIAGKAPAVSLRPSAPRARSPPRPRAPIDARVDRDPLPGYAPRPRGREPPAAVRAVAEPVRRLQRDAYMNVVRPARAPGAPGSSASGAPAPSTVLVSPASRRFTGTGTAGWTEYRPKPKASKRILSPAEVDALLRGDRGEEDPTPLYPSAAPAVRPAREPRGGEDAYARLARAIRRIEREGL